MESENASSRCDARLAEILRQSWSLRYILLEERGCRWIPITLTPPTRSNPSPLTWVRCTGRYNDGNGWSAWTGLWSELIDARQRVFQRRQAELIAEARHAEAQQRLDAALKLETDTRRSVATALETLERATHAETAALEHRRRQFETEIATQRAETRVEIASYERDREALIDRASSLDQRLHHLDERERQLETREAAQNERTAYLEAKAEELEKLDEELLSTRLRLSKIRKQNEEALKESHKIKFTSLQYSQEIIDKEQQILALDDKIENLKAEIETWILELNRFYKKGEFAVTAPVFCPYCIHSQGVFRSPKKPRVVSVEHERRLKLHEELLDVFALGCSTPSAIHEYWHQVAARKQHPLEQRRQLRFERSQQKRRQYLSHRDPTASP